ncbi:cytochrome P450 [Peterkaempfera bronchialis]|uniref:Cytochrome P450 n=1 Tax=Peterkaempfera bronchialis TaxID=2126346 RepID=A0A345SXE1_9ACTN|nr:cytochrome P450 [Peterkaempfera bronchialis]AXI78396.1 cytochrome P450 [Peterkaempfera bronchialis]
MTDTDTPSEAPAPPGCPAHAGAVALDGLQFQQTTAELYRKLRREHGAVAPVVLDGGVPAWLVLGYREVHYVTSNDQLFARDSRRWHAWDSIPDDWPLLPYVGYQPSVLFTEGAEHRRRSGAISDALGGVDQFELQSTCERIADQLIDAFAGRGAADLMADYAHLLPLLAVVKMCGLPDSETPDLVRDLTASLDAGEDDDPVAAYGRVQDRIQRLVESRHQRPGPDVPSRLLAHEAGLTDEQIVQDLISVIAAAQQPTANWIGNTLRLMLTDERFSVTLSGGRRSIGQALNEVLWEDTPTQNFIGRWAARDTQLAGRRIRQGDLLILGLAAANTDPQVRPDAAAGAAGNQAHLSFSHGEHQCPYPAPELAEVIAKAAVEVLLDRLPDVEVAVDAATLVWRPSIWMRGLEALPVEFSPAPVAQGLG